jgi:Colicin V production protein
MMFWAIFGAAFFASLAMMVREGLWNNAISLTNILVSGLVAFAFYAPLATYLDEMIGGEYTYLLDFVCIWVLFVVSMLICRALTGLASKTRMRFKNPIDPVGGPIVALVGAWAMAAFVMATLHTAPMPLDAFSGKLVHSENDVATASSIAAPDIAWLRFVDRVTRPDAFGHAGRDVFSSWGFVSIYADHREKYGKANAPWIRVRRS